ncbi:MAG: AAA family ATPase [Cyanobacteria bacterium SID2]|nr:AAA family ATPase [Cyanobacteria bacterium SID2]MBP0003076.1 AAA family ATPase [Cyanobacteria bacterium SBC]
MKLISIQFKNFRQFYGETPEIFLACGERNTTVFHGNNGSGKTALTNGFTWVLYERFSAAFASIDRLANKRALAEAELKQPVECSVEVRFEHDRVQYLAKRWCRAYNTKTGIEYGETQFSLQFAREDGRWMFPQEKPEDVVARILPESLHQYFFFDGERIEQLMRDDKRAEIAEATKTLLGIDAIDWGIRHLKEARKGLDNHLKGIGNPETKKFLREKQQREQALEAIDRRLVEIQAELERSEALKHALNGRLLELSGAAQLQTTRNTLTVRYEELLDRIQKARQEIARVVSTRGYTVFLSEATQQFRNLVDRLRERGEFPRGIQREFVEELLDKQRCICGNDLKPGSSSFERVRSWTNKASVADVEETAIRMSTQVDEIDRETESVWQAIDRWSEDIKTAQVELIQVEQQLDATKDQLRDFPDEDVQQLQQRLDDLETRSNELNQELGAKKQQRTELEREIANLSKQVDRQQMNEHKQLVAQRRIAATQDAIERLIQVKDRFEDKFRLSLEERVQALFRQISFTPYLPKLNEKYELQLVENTSGHEQLVAASTGENQILSLSFIGGIIDGVRAWSRNQRQTLIGPDSSTYPIVMDSPFGSLDEIYRRQVAQSIPKLANQLVVLVTKTQWRGEVEGEMENRVGREYVLLYNSPKPDCEEDSIELDGTCYPLVRRSPNEFEYTEVIPVGEAMKR